MGPAEYRAIFGEDPPPSVAGQPLPSASAPSYRRTVRPSFDASLPRSTDAAGLSESERRQQEEFLQSLAPARPPLTAADRNDWKLVRQVIDDQSLLTLRSNEAMYYGLASAVISSEADLLNHFGADHIASTNSDIAPFAASSTASSKYWVRFDFSSPSQCTHKIPANGPFPLGTTK